MDYLLNGSTLRAKYAPLAYPLIAQNRSGLSRLCDTNVDLTRLKRVLLGDLLESVVCKRIYEWMDSLDDMPTQLELSRQINVEISKELCRCGFKDQIPLLVAAYKANSKN